ncbi:MAG: ATP-binding protein, partial [Sneathiella sp.]
TTMGDILNRISPIEGTTLCRDVAELFRDKEQVRGFAVVEQGNPIGIIARDELIIRLATQYGHAVYGKRAVTELMDDDPLIVDINESVDEVEERIASGYSQALQSGFIVTDNGIYQGMGTGLSLLKSSVERTRLRNAQLEAITELAQHANSLKSQFLANMSHELRTPLNAVIGFAELIVSEAFGPVGQIKYRDYAQDILESGKHLLSMINDILDMSKIEAGRYQLTEGPVELNRLIEGAVKMCRILAEEKEITLTNSCLEKSPILHGDERALKQMLLNLISNGIKYTPEQGTVSVTIQTAVHGGVSVAVSDTGIGIDESLIGAMLEPFAQAGTDMHNKTEGTGLGLPIVKALAELHDARFELKSASGQGTTAVLHFPASRVQKFLPLSAA